MKLQRINAACTNEGNVFKQHENPIRAHIY